MKNRKLITALLCATMAIAPMNLNVFFVSAEKVSITDIDQIQEMLTVFLEENNLDASVVSNEKYPGYQPVVVEYNMDAEVDAYRAIIDYIIETNIDLYNICLMPMKDGVSSYLIPIDYSVQGTGCILNDSDDYDDTGNPSSSTTAIYNPHISYLEEFLELPLEKIEKEVHISQAEVARGGVISVNFNAIQLQNLLTELEPEKMKIQYHKPLFIDAFMALLLEKVHLTGIYDAFNPQYTDDCMPGGWNFSNPFSVEEWFDSTSSYISVILPFDNRYAKECVFVYNGYVHTVDFSEALLRSLYVINTYGEKDYVTYACLEAPYSGDVNCDNKISISDAVLLSR